MPPIPSVLKRAALAAARYSGVNRAVRGIFRDRLTILCYHGVVSGEHPGDFNYRNTVGGREFKHQLESLARWFVPVSAADLRAWVEGRAPLPKRPALVTFDDGYRNNLLAAAWMERYGIPAAIHVSTGYVGSGRMLWCEELRLRVLRWPKPKLPMPAGEPDRQIEASSRPEISDAVRRRCKRLPAVAVVEYLDRLRETPIAHWTADEELFEFMSWDEVRNLRRRGFEIGSHTVEHTILSQAGADALNRELVDSKAAIERETGCECYCIAYPNGGREDFNAEVLSSVRAAGYKLGFTMTGQMNRAGADPLALSRINMPGHLPREQFESRMSGLYALARR